jgi:DNA methyltransferase 1-associated protein 1
LQLSLAALSLGPMADLKDILGLERKAADAKNGKAGKLAVKRPEGVSRELWNLQTEQAQEEIRADAIPSIVPTMGPGAAVRDREPSRSGRWEWAEFHNAARTDGFRLSHWVRTSDKGKDYMFARFNKSAKVPTYTDEEYEQYGLADPNWSKPETDQLMELARRFDLRFVVMADRMPGSRSCEQLKERFYHLATTLLYKQSAEDVDISQHDLVRYPFDKVRPWR